jgi:hypothetical protein
MGVASSVGDVNVESGLRVVVAEEEGSAWFSLLEQATITKQRKPTRQMYRINFINYFHYLNDIYNHYQQLFMINPFMAIFKLIYNDYHLNFSVLIIFYASCSM